MSRYFFYDNDEIPKKYEETVPQVFPTTAPGNFTYLPENGHYVMTTFYPYQWDLNYRNPRVFNEMMYNFLYLTNQGIDIVRIDAVPYIWKELGTTCRNLKQVHTIVRMMRMIAEIVCPGVILTELSYILNHKIEKHKHKSQQHHDCQNEAYEFHCFFHFHLPHFVLFAVLLFKKRLCKKQNRFECPDKSGPQAASGIQILSLFAFLSLYIIIRSIPFTRPHASTRSTNRPIMGKTRMQIDTNTRMEIEKNTARMAVSLQTAAESAVQADAAQQVAGAQLDASEQAVFFFAVNCIMVRTSLK